MRTVMVVVDHPESITETAGRPALSGKRSTMISNLAVEAAARAEFEHEFKGTPAEWGHMSEETRNRYRQRARVGLEAADRLIARTAWDWGFSACNAEYTKQRQDPTYPIHRTNPYGDLL